MTQDTINQLKAQDWAAILATLTVYAEGLLRKQGSRATLPEGADLASDAVRRVHESITTGKYEWEPGKGALLPFLKMQVKNLLLDHLRSASRRHEVTTAEIPESLTEHVYELFRADMDRSLEGDEVASRVFNMLANGFEQSYVMQELNIGRREMEKIKSRIAAAWVAVDPDVAEAQT